MNGTNWANAFPGTSLQTAIDASAAGDEVWVAAGTYTPTLLADRNAAFAMRDGVAIYGGFQGTETSISQRRITCGQYSILSGEIGAPGNADNSYHVVRNGNLSATAILDGFVIRDANNERVISTGESGNGGGIYNGGSGTGNNCSPTIRNCIITQNTARYGAGIFNNAFNGGTASVTISHCIIAYNTALEGGGGIDFFAADGGTAQPIISNTLVCNNIAQDLTSGQGAAGMYLWGGLCSPTIINSAFVNNVSQGMGGGIIIDDTPLFGGVSGTVTVNIQNSIFFGNTAATNGPQFTIKAGGDFSATYSLVDMTSPQQTPFPISGAGTGNITMLNPNFVNITNPMGADGCWLTADDGLQLQNTSPCLNAGDNVGVTATDIWGVSRILGGTVDIGTYEFRALGITSFSPLAASTGGTITITGTGFIGTSAVRFGGLPASMFTVDSDSQITATLAGGASGNVEVVASSTVTLPGFTFVVPVATAATITTITSFIPTFGSAGTAVVITGTGFTGTTAVSLGGVPASSFIVHSNTHITAILGSGTPVSGGQQLVTVTTSAGLFSAGGFFVGAPALGNMSSSTSSSGSVAPQRSVIIGFEPRVLSYRTPITLTGFGFSGATGLLLGGVPVTNFSVLNDNTISAIVGGIPVNNRVELVGGLGVNGDMGGYGLIYMPLPSPTISALSQTQIIASDTDVLLTVSGQNFMNDAVLTMWENNAPTNITASFVPPMQYQTANNVVMTVPAEYQSIGVRRIVLTNPDGQSASVTLAIVGGNNMKLLNAGMPVVISTIASGRAFSVQLRGVNFFRTMKAFVGNTPAKVHVPSSTQAIVEIPASFNDIGGIRIPLQLLAKDGQSTSATVNIERRAPPTVLSVIATSGGLLRIRGINFMSGIHVTLGVTMLLVVSSDSDREVVARLPSLLPNGFSNSPTITIHVENPDGQKHAVIIPRSLVEMNITNASARDAETTTVSNTSTGTQWNSEETEMEHRTEKHSSKPKRRFTAPLRYVYPNPVEDELHIYDDGHTNISIYEASGRIVLEERCGSGVVDIRSLSAGIYLLVIKDAHHRVWQQLFVKK